VTLTFDPKTFDLKHLQRSVCDVIKLFLIKLERNRIFLGGVIAISVFYLITLNIELRIALGSGIILTFDNSSVH